MKKINILSKQDVLKIIDRRLSEVIPRAINTLYSRLKKTGVHKPILYDFSSVNELELSVRSANCLNCNSINTIGELCRLSESDLLHFRGFGKHSRNDILQQLWQHGRTLRGSPLKE